MPKHKKQEDFFKLYEDSNQEEAPFEEEMEEFTTHQIQERSTVAPVRFKKAHGMPFVGIFLFMGIAATLAWLGYHFFGGLNTHRQFASIEIDAPSKTPSGSEVTYTIILENKDDRPLNNTSLLVEFPTDFQFVRSTPEPENTNKNFWKVGMIGGGQKAIISLTGVLVGKQSEEKTIAAEFHYTPPNISSEFIVRESRNTTISTSLLSVTIEGQNQAVPGKEISYTIAYPDFSFLNEKDLVALRVILPDGFTVTQVAPKSKNEREWTADVLLPFIDAAKRTGSITIKGIYGDTANGTLPLTASIGFLRDGIFLAEQEQSYATQIVRGDLEIALLVNGSSEKKPINMDETVDFTISYANKGVEPIRNISIKALLSCPCIDWKTLTDTHNGIFSDGTITWTDTHIQDLALLVPGARGEIRFSLKTKNPLDFSPSKDSMQGGALAIESYFIASFDQRDSRGGSEHMEVKSGTVYNDVNTDLVFTSYGRYYDDEKKAVGAGPIPPKATQTTTYRAYWVMQNSFHELQDIIVTGTLGAGVQWIDRYDRKAGDVRYDPQSREITWTLNRMPLGVSVLSANFDIGITPQGLDVGTVMPLLSNTEILAKDGQTGARIHLKAKALTTSIETDPIAGGNGVVGE